MEILVSVKNVYGNDLVYPMCDTGRKLAQLAGKKTLTHREIEIIKALGYTLKVVTPTL